MSDSYPIPDRQPFSCPYCDMGCHREHGHLWCRRKAARSHRKHPKFTYRPRPDLVASSPPAPGYRGNGNPHGERA